MEEQFDIRDYKPTGKERDFENALRPLQFEDFSGQDKVVDTAYFVKAADLYCCTASDGDGDATLSNGLPGEYGVIANELGVGFRVTSGPVGTSPRPGGSPDQPGTERCIVYRRNTPLESGRGRIPVFGNGRLPDRHHDRQRPVGTQHPA